MVCLEGSDFEIVLGFSFFIFEYIVCFVRFFFFFFCKT
jgi:hypothetical protein